MTDDKPSLSERGARVLRFRREQAPPRGPVPDMTEFPVPDMTEFHEYGQGVDDYRHRMLVNVAAFVFVVALIAAGIWLADTMARMNKNQDCVLSGRRGCTPVDVVPKDRW